LERKTIEPICLAYSSKKEVRSAPFFLSSRPWDNEAVGKTCPERPAKEYDHPEATLRGDSRYFHKQGHRSVGVDRQYRGIKGPVDNRQAIVTLSIAGSNGGGIMDYQPRAPDSWFNRADSAARRADRRVPEDVTPKTKNQLPLEMIAEAIASRTRAGKDIGVDSDFGGAPNFLHSSPKSLYIGRTFRPIPWRFLTARLKSPVP
jgi:SRSO17 transposase